ncbi:uncharacterized protein NEMAJ01_0566 [Nematocida major]|uniref:uncharacterized protein n=1 Tax=Nematocida major TaxID=1912982 RepID=UPI0020083A8B|nr:uncharacterized protein NEMAJ01_0566 [Nematocida major]KAH9385670.1 hypothetical protein NEMAJ01_0566 [Nematocida major]
MDYLSWLAKGPAVSEITGFEEYIRKEKEESMRIMKRRLKKGKASDKQTAEDVLGVANKLYVRGDFMPAIEKIKESLSYHSTFDSAYYLLGIIYEELGDAERSFNAFLIAASIKRTDVNLWRKLLQYKQEEGDLEYQLYILKRLKKIKETPEILEEILGIYERQGNIEKVLEVKAEMVSLNNFPPEFIEEVLSRIKKLRNSAKIVDTVSRILDRDKPFSTVSDTFLIGYVDILFSLCKYDLISQLNNSLAYCRRLLMCTRTEIILFFSSVISEISTRCSVCPSLCTCKETAEIDTAQNIVIHAGKKSAVVSVPVRVPAITDLLHLPLAGCFLDTLIRMRKYKVALKILEWTDAAVKWFLSGSASSAYSEEMQGLLVAEVFSVKRKVALVHEKMREYHKSILAYKEILSHRDRIPYVQSIQGEVHMRISEIYRKTGNIDLALEYALQIESSQVCSGIEKSGLVFYRAADCMQNRSIMYKAMHVYETEKILRESAVRKYFVQSAQELVVFLLQNPFIFYRRKVRKEENGETGSLVNVREIEADYALLQEITGLGKVLSDFPEGESSTKSVYYDGLASLLGGISVQEWCGIVQKYVTALFCEEQFETGMLLLRKVLTSQILRSQYEEYTALLWLLIRMSVDARDADSLHWGLTHALRYYANREGFDAVSFYYLSYFLIGQLPKFHRRSQFYKFQKNIQRNLRRKDPSRDSSGNVLTLTCFSYMPSFIYANTVDRLIRDVEGSVLSSLDSSLLGISRAVALSSLFLSHASSRKVTDRSMCISRGVKILHKFTSLMQEMDPPHANSVSILCEGESVVYAVRGEILPGAPCEESNVSEKLAILLYNSGRAYHQYKLYGLAEKAYAEALLYTKNQELVTLLQINMHLLGKKVRIEPVQ